MRRSGILMHITSLPGPNGVGTMGREAFKFVDFLKSSGQSDWQILPLTPTGYGDSPYQSCSTFAGNHYLIDLEKLVDSGLLTPEEVGFCSWGTRADKTDFGALYQGRLKVLRTAYARFEPDAAYDAFILQNAGWLPDFALFMALKDECGGKAWYTWEKGLKFRETEAVWEARQRLRSEIGFYNFVQYLFYTQWNALHAYASKQGVRIIGDVPIYVPYDSVDVWSSPELFQLDEDLTPTAVAGCPPDAFSADGQLWGNPLYRWDVMKKNGYSWWLRRLSAAGKLYDVVRMDHFRGLSAYWSVPFGDKTAKGGKWIDGPGMSFVEAVREGLPELNMIAEDLGYLTQDVLDLRDNSGYPGMKVLQFAFDSREPSDYLPHTYTRNSVCYTGTHDNMTTAQWFETGSEEMREYASEYMCLNEKEGIVRGVIRTAMSSVSDMCIIPMQDWLELGAEARMNFPGSFSDSNWTWRAKAGFMTAELAADIQKMTALYARLGTQSVKKDKKTEQPAAPGTEIENEL